MSDDTLRHEVEALREQVARLEADRARPVAVEGFEGLRQLSHAIETKNLDAFLLDRGIPDRWFWGGVLALVFVFIAVFGYSFAYHLFL
ncbi:hypothetical protein KZX46_21440 (plasmid) [Polymorphobacter sp. PAMC 29334]|uniref:hypothetical protein n=1 Tax=Polymorphobacter sp. PAMC 29334 TaxID=2862331 RepID=UPI001C752CA4|nr:hypothetical protein [Polymorphobacter sp. PAMC 29334]QYE37202.1 hypothetical protein KZX46_21440 [Polymorphobacter sp. PAMC 29334]